MRISAPDWNAGASTAGASTAGATRRQLSFIALPILAGWFLLREVGQSSVGPAVAMALLVIVTVVSLAILILRDGRVLNRLDQERREKVELQQRLSREMTEQLAAQAGALAEQGAERAKAEAAMYRAQRMEAVGQLTGGIVGGKVLVIDDAAVRAVIVNALGAVGFDVTEAAIGSAGLAQLDQSKAAAAVIDFLMPE